jgi:outer membrane protein OmpA-like peptidoglycan-associated protein
MRLPAHNNLQYRPADHREGTLSKSFTDTAGILRKTRYLLLAGAMLAIVAAPLWSAASNASDGAFVVAQRSDPNDPNQQKGKQKGQQGQQGQQKGQQGQQKGQQGQAQPQQGGQPQQKQFGKQTPGEPQHQGQQILPGQQGGPAGQSPGGAVGQQQDPKQKQQQQQKQQKQFGKQTPGGGTPAQGQQGGAGQGVGGLPPTGPGGQQKQIGKQTPGGTPAQGQQGGAGQGVGGLPPTGPGGQQKQFGKQTPGGTPAQGQQGGAGQGVGGLPPTGPGGQQKQFGKQTPGQPGGPGAQPQRGGTGVATVEQLKQERHEHTEGGRTIIEEPGKRVIVREGGRTVIAHDEDERFRRFHPDARVERRGSEMLTVYERPGGVQIVNITDPNGRLLRRVRRDRDGREIVLIENSRGPGFGTGLAIGLVAGVAAGIGASVFLDLPPPVVTIPRERYIVDIGVATPVVLYETLEAPPLVPIERAYTLDEVRYNVALRDRMRRIDINTINFAFGAWDVAPDEYGPLAEIGQSMQRILSRDPDEVFMVEGHTDAVGSEEDNLSLSDRRAESVAVILSQQYGISPENLVTQGYGKQFLKIPTLEPNRENRRVAVRRVTPLLRGQQASR